MINRHLKLSMPCQAYYYALSISDELDIENKELISTSRRFSYLYAKWVLKGRFQLGEKSISKDIHYSVLYVENILVPKFKHDIPIDFLELCSINVLNHLLVNLGRNDNIIKVLFSKKILGE